MQYFNVIKSISTYWDVRYPSIPNQQEIHIRTVDTGFEETKTYWTLDSHLWGGQDLCHVLIFRMTLPLEFLLPRSWNHSPLKPDTWKTNRKSCPFLGISQHFLQKCLITKKPRCDAKNLAFKASFNSFGRRLASPGTPLPTWCFAGVLGSKWV